jgi:1-acylglycerol-3-phosphate O-acyltransferase
MLRKANQWCLLGIPGVWWIDLQIDGVRRGSLARGPQGHLPYPGSIIASSHTSPLDVLYLAAIFDPVFTQSYPNSRLVRPITQESALAACFGVPNPLNFGSEEDLIDLATLVKQNRNRAVVVFPETTTSNGRGILRLSPSLLSAGNTKVFPVSLKYTPPDVVTPIPGWSEIFRFVWRLNSGASHCIRVRIGGPISMVQSSEKLETGKTNSRAAANRDSTGRNGFESNYFDTLPSSHKPQADRGVTPTEQKALDAVADDLARLGRVKRVDLGLEEKVRFVEVWRNGSKGKMRSKRA